MPIHPIRQRERFGSGHRFQFPLIPGHAVTVNAAQGESLDRVYAVLGTTMLTSSKVLVALTRCTQTDQLLIDCNWLLFFTSCLRNARTT